MSLRISRLSFIITLSILSSGFCSHFAYAEGPSCTCKAWRGPDSGGWIEYKRGCLADPSVCGEYCKGVPQSVKCDDMGLPPDFGDTCYSYNPKDLNCPKQTMPDNASRGER